jgi:DHA1 family tetracycline resistance protein-like MFS transporter
MASAPQPPASHPASGAPAPGRAAFAFIFVTVLLDMLALGIMVPVLPRLVVQFQDGDVGRAAAVTGVFGFAWALMQFVCSPVLGALSDRVGRRPVILLSNLGLGLDYVLMAVAPSLAWLFAGRLLSGVTAASFSTASAYIADVTPPERRAARFGMLGAAFGLGFVVGPALGGVLGGVDLRLPFWVAAALSLANALYGFFILPESLPPEKRAKAGGWRRAGPLAALRLLRTTPGMAGLAGTAVLYFLAHEALPSMFVLYTGYRYGWGETQVGLVLAVIGVCSTVVSAALVGPAVKRLGERRALLVGLSCGLAGFALYGLAPTGALFLVGVPLVGLWGLTGPAMQALMSQRVGGAAQGQLQGALSSLRGLTGMGGPLLFTQAFTLAVGAGAPLHLPGAPYLLAAGLLGLSLLLALRVARPAPQGQAEAAPAVLAG